MNKFNVALASGRWTGIAALAAVLLSGCGGGSSPQPPAPVNNPPVAVFTLAGLIEAGTAGADATAYTGNELSVDASSSTDAEGDALRYKWTIVSKPAGSTLALADDTAPKQTIRPDVAGTVMLSVRVSDSKGLATEKKATLLIRSNVAPLASVAINASYPGQTTVKAVQAVSIGASIALTGVGSVDADGDLVSTEWTLTDKPAGSSASLAVSGAATSLLADVAGIYKVRARGTDARGAWSETVYVFDASNRAPQAPPCLLLR